MFVFSKFSCLHFQTNVCMYCAFHLAFQYWILCTKYTEIQIGKYCMRIADLGLFYDSIGLIAVLFDLLSFKNCNCSSPDLFDLQFFLRRIWVSPFWFIWKTLYPLTNPNICHFEPDILFKKDLKKKREDFSRKLELYLQKHEGRKCFQ